MSYSTPSGMNPPRSATITSGSIGGAAASSGGGAVPAGSGSAPHAASNVAAMAITQTCTHA